MPASSRAGGAWSKSRAPGSGRRGKVAMVAAGAGVSKGAGRPAGARISPRSRQYGRRVAKDGSSGRLRPAGPAVRFEVRYAMAAARWPNRCRRSSRTATGGATCRSRWSCRTAAGSRCRLDAEIEIVARTWRGLKALASPALGDLARAYVRTTTSISPAARAARARRRRVDGRGDRAWTRSARARLRIFLHQHRSNRRNIQHHYDVSDAFYRLWLDSRMVYSCAYFRTDGDTLDDAQAAKLDHVCRKLC